MTGTVSTVPKQPRQRELSDLSQRIDSRLGLTAILILAIAAAERS